MLFDDSEIDRHLRRLTKLETPDALTKRQAAAASAQVGYIGSASVGLNYPNRRINCYHAIYQ
jgi:hypothetical protein